MGADEGTAARLRALLLAEDPGILAGGRLLPERALAGALGIGRRDLRQALGVLETEGMIRRRQGQGTFLVPQGPVTPDVDALISRTSPAEIVEVRRSLEPQLARIAALRATPSDIEALHRLAEQGAEAATGTQYERLDSQFHGLIAECVRNTLFLDLFRLVASVRTAQNWSGMRERTFEPALRDRLVAQHRGIAEAIGARDPDLAQARMAAHLGLVGDMVGD